MSAKYLEGSAKFGRRLTTGAQDTILPDNAL
jgi:hypothetical protein